MFHGDWGLGIVEWGWGSGDGGWGIGDWAQPPIPNPQSPIPNPQSPISILIIYKIFLNFNNFLLYKDLIYYILFINLRF